MEEYDDPEVNNIDDILNSPDPFEEFEEKDKRLKAKGASTGLGTITKKELEELEDDEAIIDLFTKNPDRFKMCEFYQRGHCKFGDACKYFHPPPE